MLLVYIRQFHRLTYFKLPCVDALQAHDEAEKCGLSCTVRTYDTHNAVWREHEIEVGEECFLAERLRYVLCLDDLVAQSWSVRDKYLEFLLTFFLFLIEHCIVRIQTRLTLCLTRLWCHMHPFQLSFESLAALGGSLLLLCHALCLLVEP